jgi:hypothetical protein
VLHGYTKIFADSGVRFILGEEGCVEYVISDESAGGRTVISKA